MTRLPFLLRFSLGGLALLAASCHALTTRPPVDLAEPGWDIRRGQAVWRPFSGAETLAGELVVALHHDGRSFVQFAKPPLPIVTAQTDPHGWSIQFMPENQSISGRGSPPSRWMWLHLPEHLRESPVEDSTAFQWTRGAAGDWTLGNERTGERISGYLDP